MRQNGRQSAAAAEIIGLRSYSGDPRITRRGRQSYEFPEAPQHLTREERQTWEGLVRAMPADWFKEQDLPLLETLCAQIKLARLLEAELRERTGAALRRDMASLRRFEKLTAMYDKCSKTIMSLSGKLRLAKNSLYEGGKAGRAVKKQALEDRPWEAEADD